MLTFRDKNEWCGGKNVRRQTDIRRNIEEDLFHSGKCFEGLLIFDMLDRQILPPIDGTFVGTEPCQFDTVIMSSQSEVFGISKLPSCHVMFLT